MCVVCGGRPFYSLDRLVPAIPSYGNISNQPLVDQINLPTKTHLDGRWARFGRPMGLAGPTSPPLATAFVWVTARWVLALLSLNDLLHKRTETDVAFTLEYSRVSNPRGTIKRD